VRSHAKAPSVGSIWTAATSALVLSLVFLALSSAPAFAAPGHPVLRAFSTGIGSEPQTIAIDGSDNVYLLESEAQRVVKVDSSGNPVPFSSSAPYVKGNALLGTSNRLFEFFPWGINSIAVDRSGGADDGNIYVTAQYSSPVTFVFDSTGAYVGELSTSGLPCGVAVDQATGGVYIGDLNVGSVFRFDPPGANPSAATPDATLTAGGSCHLAVDSTGAAYYGDNLVRKYDASQFGVASPVASAEFESITAPIAVDPGNDDFFVDTGTQIVQRTSAGVQLGSPFGALSGSLGIAIGGSGEIFATEAGGGVVVFGSTQVNLPLATTGATTNVVQNSADLAGTVDPDSAGPITGCEFRYGRDSGDSEGSIPCSPAASSGSPINAPTAVTASLTGLTAGSTYHYRLFVTNANGTQAGSNVTFATPPALEGVSTGAATEVTKDGASLNGSYVGDGQDTHYYFEYGTTTKYGQTAPAPPGNDAGSAAGPQTVAPVHIGALLGETTYHYRLVASNSYGETRGQDEALTTPPAVTGLSTDPPTNVTDESAALNASFDGDGTYETHYYFEWGVSTAYGNTTPVPPGAGVPAGTGRIALPPITIAGLKGGLTYHYRVVASNATGTTTSADAFFKTAEAPLLANLNSRNVQATSAELLGEVNPRYGATTYRFEWGPTAAYGNQSPVVDASVGSGNALVPVSAELSGLTAGVTYHFRLVATNQYGTTRSPDQTLGFYPPNCPNAQLRQETRSITLPDCRAYELVTPSFANGSIIFPLGGPAAPLATSPSKLAYSAAFGVFPESTGKPANNLADMFVSTRSDTGWYQKFTGRPGTETFAVGGPPRDHQEGYLQSQFGPSRSSVGAQASPTMEKLANYDEGWPDIFKQQSKASNAPYVWNTSTGSLLERWPSNLADVTEGEEFVGTPEISADFSHFVFQSNLVFAKGGNYVERHIVCCDTSIVGYGQAPPASIYDNDLKTGGVELASIKGDETTGFEGYVYNISEDGSRILMAEERSERAMEYLPSNTHLVKDLNGPFYLRVGGEHTIEIGAGHKLAYVGSAADGKTIYFRSTEQLAPDDQDSSTDLYVWHESDPGSLTLVSIGDHGNAGNTDDCNGGGGCNVEVIDFLTYSGINGQLNGFNGGQGGNGYTDSAIASGSGDIYFTSPESLLEGKGEPGKANLYLYRKGTLRFVTTLDPQPTCTGLELTGACAAGPVARMQVTPDGTHMAFVVQSKITSYDNAGKGEMYTYDPETGRIACASCRPDGQPPTSQLLASQNGLFQTYDGRVFFSTQDPLVPRDTNGVEDIYEYTEGRPQLISSGLGIQFHGYNGFQGLQNAIGLVSVSANGTDVYFATSDSMVTQDHNGAALKIYDARTGGGFPAELTPPNCSAADECHGPGVTPSALPPDRTSAALGLGPKPKSHKAKKHAKRHKKKATKKKGAAKKKGRVHHG
jgi:hypothetical protein